MWVTFYFYADTGWKFVPAPSKIAAEHMARQLEGKPRVYSVGVSRIENVFKPDGACHD
jgi:hypothetical protein